MLNLPARTIEKQRIQFPVKNIWGTNLKMEVRNAAKILPLYHTPVKIEPEVTGRTDDGQEIPINTLGKWLFGVPGFAANMVVESFHENVCFRLPDVPEAIKLISKAVEILSGGENQVQK